MVWSPALLIRRWSRPRSTTGRLHRISGRPVQRRGPECARRGRQTTVKTPARARLAHARSPRDNAFIAQLLCPEIALRRPPMTTIPGAHVVPREPDSLPELRAADQGVALIPGSRPLRQHPPHLRRPVATVRRLVRGGETHRPCRPSPSPLPVTWPPGRAPAHPSPPCGWPRRPSPRLMSGRNWNRPAGTRGCARH